MRELDRTETKTTAPALAPQGPSSGEETLLPRTGAVIGNGRAGRALADALSRSGIEITGPLGRDEQVPSDVHFVLICTPDAAIAEVAALIPEGPAIGHCCGSHGPEILPAHRPSFCVHPLMTINETSSAEAIVGSWAAVDGNSSESLALAELLASACEMNPVRIAAEDRAMYHAAASVASNLLIALEAAAEELGGSAGLPRDALVPLVTATVQNWADLGAADALTGPVARGDHETVARQRAAIAARCEHLLPVFDVLCDQAREVAKSGALT